MKRHGPDYRHTAWGVRPETLPAIAAALRGLRAATDAERERLQAAARAAANVTGGVAVLSLRGLITPRPSFLSVLLGGGGGLEAFRGALREAVASDDVAAIILDVDSPGGSTDLVPETAADIRHARASKPVIAVANTWAASAAYWLAAQADEVVVTPSGEVGSIGVFTLHEEFSGMDERLGITTTLISAGKYKTEANPYEPLSDEARQALQDKVDEFYRLFVADVAQGRGVTAGTVRGGFGEGRMVSAKQAVTEGMADRIDTLEATIARVVGNPARARRAETPRTEGIPQPNPSVQGGEEATARPSQSYIDLMYGVR